MIEYRQYIPPESEDDVHLVERVEKQVCETLSRQANPHDDLDEATLRQARKNLSERSSRDGGFWIHSYLDLDPQADYLAPTFVEPNKVDVPFATVHDPVDLTPDELAEHLERKAAR